MRTATLENGLQVLLSEQHTAPVATFWVWYRVGSRNEVPGLTGISHWVEHMLFKGTPTHPKGTLTRSINRLGGRWNAFTWKDYTAYHEVLPAEHLPVAVELEADRMAHTIFDPAEVESERTVIISEREGSENFPAYLLREEVDAVAHKIHPYRFPVIGWKDDLRAISRDDLFQHYRTFYHPSNAILVAVGAFDAEVTLDLIRRAFADIPAGPALPPVRSREPAQEGERRVVLQRAGGATAYLHLAYHVPAGSHADLPALLVADGLLSGFSGVVPFDQGAGGRSSRLYRALVESTLASDVGSSIIPSVDPTLFRITATARAGVEVAALEERTLAELARLAGEPVDSAELAKVKKQAKAQFVFAQDGVYRTAMGLGVFAVVDGPEGFETLLRRIEQVIPEDVMRVAATYVLDKNRTTGWYLPESAAAAPRSGPSYAAFHPGPFWFSQPGRTETRALPRTERDGVLPIAPEVVARAELENGLVALVRENRGSGLVAVHGLVKAGAMFDESRSGLARVVAALLQRGTRTRTSQEIAVQLEGMGASLTFHPNLETVAISLRVLQEDAAAAVAIMGEMLTSPTFPGEEVEKARGEILTALRVGLQDTRQVAERTFRSLLFPSGHPQAHLPDGDVLAVETTRREDLVAFHQERYRPEATILSIVGDIAAAEALEIVGRIFSTWPRQGVWRLPHLPAVPPRAEPLRGEARLAGKIQSDIVLGAPGIAREDPAYYEMMMANLILGQIGMMGRLGDRVRERQGMAYYAYSELRAGLLAGPWTVRAGVNAQNEHRAVESIVEEIRRFQEEGPAEEEVTDARDFLIGFLAVRLETNPGIAQTLAEIELFDLGLDYLARYPQIIRGITREGVIEAARRFPLRSYCVAIAGPPPALTTAG